MSVLQGCGLYRPKSCSQSSLLLLEVLLSNDMLPVCMHPPAVALQVHPGEAPVEAAILRQDKWVAQLPAAQLQHCDGLLLSPLHAPAMQCLCQPEALQTSVIGQQSTALGPVLL